MSQIPAKNKTRILIYSHDTFGLGHIRRCREIANSLVNRFDDLSIFILSGSPLISQFEFNENVDFVRIPGVIKLKDGRYTSLKVSIDISEIMQMREAIIQHTARVFKPDVFIVDKEPLGLHKEIEQTLHLLKEQGCKTVLGLRDVLDEPEKLKREWQNKNALEAAEHLYDEIWVYGSQDFYEPLQGIPLSEEAQEKIHYTGYINRQYQPISNTENILDTITSPYLLVTAGGGKDGEDAIDLVMDAFKQNHSLPYHGLVVLGPFMSKTQRAKHYERARHIDNVTVLDFHNRMEALMYHAAAVVCMGGYNTFCEILSFNKPAIIIPRFTPRLEQSIRAYRAQEYQLCQVLDVQHLNESNQADHVEKLTRLIQQLPDQQTPQHNLPAEFLAGIEVICDRVKALTHEGCVV